MGARIIEPIPVYRYENPFLHVTVTVLLQAASACVILVIWFGLLQLTKYVACRVIFRFIFWHLVFLRLTEMFFRIIAKMGFRNYFEMFLEMTY